MKIAALYDIHGNLPALNAVLEELKEVRPDLIIVGGDIVLGPIVGPTIERLAQPGERVRYIRGNGDREVVTAFDGQPLTRQYLPPISEKARKEIHWVAEQLTRAQRDFLAVLPERIELQIENLGNVVFCHATLHNDEEVFTSATPQERLDRIFSHAGHDLVICGHTHNQFERHVGNLRILNAGSVGMPFTDQPGAYWLLLSPQGYEFRRTMYDREAAAQIIRASGNPSAQEFAEKSVLNPPAMAEMIEMLERIAQNYK